MQVVNSKFLARLYLSHLKFLLVRSGKAAWPSNHRKEKMLGHLGNQLS